MSTRCSTGINFKIEEACWVHSADGIVLAVKYAAWHACTTAVGLLTAACKSIPPGLCKENMIKTCSRDARYIEEPRISSRANFQVMKSRSPQNIGQSGSSAGVPDSCGSLPIHTDINSLNVQAYSQLCGVLY